MEHFSKNRYLVPVSPNRSGFTLIEVLIAILIFGLGLISAFVLSSTASSLSMRSKQEIIATNLLREQLELFKNIRDTNFLALRDFNSLRGVSPACSGDDCKIEYGYSSVGTRYSTALTPVSFTKNIFGGATGIPTVGPGWNTPNGIQAHKALVSDESHKPKGSSAIRYCQDSVGRYRLDCDASMKLTPYYGFVLVQPVLASGTSTAEFAVENAFKVSAYFATTEGGYREMSMSTIITDFKK